MAKRQKPWTAEAIREVWDQPKIHADTMLERDARGHTGWTAASLDTAVGVQKIQADLANLVKPPEAGSEEKAALDQVLELLGKIASAQDEMSKRLFKMDNALFALEQKVEAMEEAQRKGFLGLLDGVRWLGGLLTGGRKGASPQRQQQGAITSRT
jgi:hypothetical protein